MSESFVKLYDPTKPVSALKPQVSIGEALFVEWFHENRRSFTGMLAIPVLRMAFKAGMAHGLKQAAAHLESRTKDGMQEAAQFAYEIGTMNHG